MRAEAARELAPGSSSSSEPDSDSESDSSGRVFLRFLRDSSSTTSLNRAKRRMASAASASRSSTRLDRRDLAWAVERRMSVSSVRDGQRARPALVALHLVVCAG